MKNITAYCLSWHLQKSDAFRDLLEEPLRSYAKVNFKRWDGETLTDKPDKNSCLVFCMLPPTEKLLKQGYTDIAWIPMWDQAQGYSDTWWLDLPKNLKIIAYSDVVFRKASKAGLPAIRLHYFKDTQAYKPASWENGRIAYYWNRVGMIGAEFLEKFCESAKISELLFNPDIDPGIEGNKYYELPEIIGRTKVTTIHRTKSREDALRQIEPANIVISPRLTEGAGMVFLESMARGCAVVAHNAPTMNEYIRSNENGLLVNDGWFNLSDRLKIRYGFTTHHRTHPYLLDTTINWKKIENASFEKLGVEAAQYTKAGYDNWRKEFSKLAYFLKVS